MSEEHQHGPGSDTEGPASAWWLVAAVLFSLVVFAIVVWVVMWLWGVIG